MASAAVVGVNIDDIILVAERTMLVAPDAAGVVAAGMVGGDDEWWLMRKPLPDTSVIDIDELNIWWAIDSLMTRCIRSSTPPGVRERVFRELYKMDIPDIRNLPQVDNWTNWTIFNIKSHIFSLIGDDDHPLHWMFDFIEEDRWRSSSIQSGTCFCGTLFGA